MTEKERVLKQYFGHSAFRAGQEDAVDAILAGRDALCVMPTGAGKSVCYQVPALVFSGITLVVSPLISLMKDQVRALTQNGIRAAYLNSSLTFRQYCKALANIRQGMYKIIYVAPERLAVPEFMEICRELPIDLVAVDEAHCISQWGQDFRPSYLKIAEFIQSLPARPPVAAFTATATAEVKEDIERSLGLRDPFRITTGFDRPNLTFKVIRTAVKFSALTEIVKRHSGEAGIVYCSTRKAVEEVGNRLNEAGFSAAVYHAGLTDEVRRQNQEDFVYDRATIMVATNAFGMGIDKSNVAYVVHYNMPKDIESYYQEAGRAGRDGSPAECVLLYSPGDVHTNKFLIDRSEPNPELTPEEQALIRERDFERLKQMTYYSTTNGCLRTFILTYFGEKAPNYCGNCSNCQGDFVKTDITEEAKKILSCVSRTGERFGKKMITDILRGSKNERILTLGLDSQTTYGLMKDKTEHGVREIMDHLEFEGFLETRGDEYPTLAITEKAKSVLFRGETVVMMQAKEKEPAASPKKAAGTESSGLLAALKALRRELAEEKKVPAYVIFSDAALVDMCRRRPNTIEEMLEVSGVGKVKAERYGERFLAVLKGYNTVMK